MFKILTYTLCPACNGSGEGFRSNVRCPSCRGSGEVPEGDTSEFVSDDEYNADEPDEVKD